MIKVYIERKNNMSSIYNIARYDDDMVLHTYFTSEKQARDFIKELKVRRTAKSVKKFVQERLLQFLQQL